MAVIEAPRKCKYQWCENLICVTKEAQGMLDSENIWYHLGGFNVEGDSCETQQHYFEKDLDEFWKELVGPYETLRQTDPLKRTEGWR